MIRRGDVDALQTYLKQHKMHVRDTFFTTPVYKS